MGKTLSWKHKDVGSSGEGSKVSMSKIQEVVDPTQKGTAVFVVCPATEYRSMEFWYADMYLLLPHTSEGRLLRNCVIAWGFDRAYTDLFLAHEFCSYCDQGIVIIEYSSSRLVCKIRRSYVNQKTTVQLKWKRLQESRSLLVRAQGYLRIFEREIVSF